MPRKPSYSALPCPECGRSPFVSTAFGHLTACRFCYVNQREDNPNDQSRWLYGCGRTEAEAVKNWNERARGWI